MTINTTASSVTLVGNGATTNFPFAFLIPDSTTIVVILTDRSVTPTLQTTLSASQFSVAGYGIAGGGTVTYPLAGPALTNQQSLTIERIVPYTQQISLSNQGAVWPSSIESALDLVTMMIQQIATQGMLAFSANPADAPPAALPPASVRANFGAAFDAAGNLIPGSTPNIAVNAAMSGLVQAASVAAALTFLGLGAKATAAQAYAGTDDTTYMTPLKTAEAILSGFNDYSDTSGAANTVTITCAPIITAYAQLGIFVVRIANTNTAGVNVNVNALGNKVMKKSGVGGLVAMSVGDVRATVPYICYYDPTDDCIVNLGTLGNASISTAMPGGMGVNNTVASNTTITMVADQLVLTDAQGRALPFGSAGAQNSATLNTANGAVVNGIRSAIAASTFYYLYWIYNPATASLGVWADTSYTAPSFPAGYTFSAFVGETVTDGSSHFLRTIQNGRDIAIKPNAGSLPALIAGGIINSQTRTAFTVVGTVVPTTASKIKALISNSGTANGTLAIAGSTDTGFTGSGGAGANPSPLTVVAVGGASAIAYGDIVLEGTSLSYISGSTALAQCSAQCYGWTTRANVS